MLCSHGYQEQKEAIPKRSNKNNAMSAAHVEAKGTSDATEVGEVAEDKAEQLKMNASSVVFELIDSFVFELGCCH